jgi:hypothetical protein
MRHSLSRLMEFCHTFGQTCLTLDVVNYDKLDNKTNSPLVSTPTPTP